MDELFKPRFKVYDEVWIMSDNRPTKLLVYAVVQEMSYWKTSVKQSYWLVSSRIGAAWDVSIPAEWDDVFATRDELLAFFKATA